MPNDGRDLEGGAESIDDRSLLARILTATKERLDPDLFPGDIADSVTNELSKDDVPEPGDLMSLLGPIEGQGDVTDETEDG